MKGGRAVAVVAILASALPRVSADLFEPKSGKSAKAFDAKSAKTGSKSQKHQDHDVNQPHKVLSPKPKSSKVLDSKAKAAKEGSGDELFNKSGKTSKTGKSSKNVQGESSSSTTGFDSPTAPAVPPAPEPQTEPQPKPQPESQSEPQPQPKRNAKWFITADPTYASIANNPLNQNIHPHPLAGMFCHRQDLFLCDYTDYCPNGKGSDPYAGDGDLGPHVNPGGAGPLVQWAPMYPDPLSADDGSANNWVQVGDIAYGEGEDMEQGTCWSYKDWTRGSGGDVADVVEVPNRIWILCCEKESRQERMERMQRGNS